MRYRLHLPHVKRKSTCYINGLYDILLWKGAFYEYFLLPTIGGMAGFAYLRFKKAVPAQMIFWGNRTKSIFSELEPILKYRQDIIESKSWKTTFSTITESIKRGVPVVAGALDMYYLPYYKELYRQIHIPIHYVLVVGYDEEKEEFYVHDCSYDRVKTIPYSQLRLALDVKVPGMSKKNTIRIINMDRPIPDELEIAESGFRHKAEKMVNPPVNSIGIPAMHKLAKEINKWDNIDYFQHMIAYAGMSPPLIPSDLTECNGLRFEQANVLEKLGKKYNKSNWIKASNLFRSSGELIIVLCGYASNLEKIRCSEIITEIADLEEKAYQIILNANG